MARLDETTDPGELRAPLDSIVAYLDLLLEEDMSEHESRRFLEVIRRTALRAQTLVGDRERPR